MTTRTTQYVYDAVGNRTRMIDPDSRTTYYTYDKVNRLTGIEVDPDSKSADYYFDAIGNITKEIKPNSAVTYYEYDDAGRMTKLENVKSDSSAISSFQYDRDKAGNITRCHRGDGATIYYEYDKAQRLASEVWKDNGSEIYSFKYDYDGVGNRSKMLKNLGGGAESTYYYYDAANRLEKEWNTTAPATTYFGYNDNGSVTRIQTASGTTYFEYNDSDLVKKITYPDASTNEFHYDGRSQRVVISDSDGTSYFNWDGINPVEEYGDTDAKYIHGYSPIAGAGSLAYAKKSAEYQIPHKDHIGSTRELSDASEIVTQYYEYDAFGTELVEKGSQANRFRFASSYMKLKDLENVYLSPTRVYHAETGRFLSRDYFLHLNEFAAFLSNPNANLDPTGLQNEDELPLDLPLERPTERRDKREEPDFNRETGQWYTGKDIGRQILRKRALRGLLGQTKKKKYCYTNEEVAQIIKDANNLLARLSQRHTVSDEIEWSELEEAFRLLTYLRKLLISHRIYDVKTELGAAAIDMLEKLGSRIAKRYGYSYWTGIAARIELLRTRIVTSAIMDVYYQARREFESTYQAAQSLVTTMVEAAKKALELQPPKTTVVVTSEDEMESEKLIMESVPDSIKYRPNIEVAAERLARGLTGYPGDSDIIDDLFELLGPSYMRMAWDAYAIAKDSCGPNLLEQYTGGSMGSGIKSGVVVKEGRWSVPYTTPGSGPRFTRTARMSGTGSGYYSGSFQLPSTCVGAYAASLLKQFYKECERTGSWNRAHPALQLPHRQ